MAEKREVSQAVGAIQYDSMPTDAGFDFWLYTQRVRYFITGETGEEKSFLSWGWYRIETPHYDLGYRNISRSQFYEMYGVARGAGDDAYSRGITLPIDTPNDYQLHVYQLFVVAAGVEYRLAIKPKPTAAEISSRTPNTNNLETFFTAETDGLHIDGAVIPYADITEVFPRIWAVKAYESPLNPYRV